MGEIKFEVLIPNESLYDLIENNDCLKNKYILSEINDFEDGLAIRKIQQLYNE